MFITFEGIEGCGKTTQVKLLTEKLAELKLRVAVTREPGGCRISDRIREILLDAENSSLTPLAELFLYAAARAQHVQEVIQPALATGKTVICDRFTDATLAYQGYGRNLDRALISRLNDEAVDGTLPDLTVLLDCPVETGLERAFSRINSCNGAREERFELESIQFHQRVRDGYLALAASQPARFVTIDGSKSIAEIESAVAAAVFKRLKL
ncbi:dTMP kinase [Geobacter sp. DSM 9736]|uniref:dTMP kinase n=1 Tax=Geobacter sp. DSM 9736 TaxID=1277350 RepID=UPI000B509420|nr:dTMP kinase [Geobacter sp. DSM 9736]SNB45081.1 thymidylate kinase [Geobacter sp. DSM 9736]